MLNDEPPRTIAAVDLGSNSFHMIVARVIDSRLHTLDRLREPVRLAAGLDRNNHITPEATQRALDCLQRFGQRLRDLPPGSVLAVGTNTLRKARNAEAFLARARLALGHPIETIAGREEARLIYLGVAHSLAADGGRRLVVDIGGGSTELIVGEHFDPHHRESLYMGCVSMSLGYFGDGNITHQGVWEADTKARLELRSVVGLFRNLDWQIAIGASGTIKAVARVAQEMGWCEHGITLDAIKRIRQALLVAGRLDKIDLKGLSPDRAPVFPGGIIILQAVFEALQVDRMMVSDGALREGLLYDLLGRIRHEDVRSKTIEALSSRYHVDKKHASRVHKTALTMFSRCTEEWGLGQEEFRNFLSWAACLHEIGLAVSHTQYHKHGAYLLEYSDLSGFSRQEQRILALLVRSHRRKFPIREFEGLQEPLFGQTLKLSLLLRLAVLLHRSRSEKPLPDIQFQAKKRGLRLRFPDGWLQAHPLNRADLEQEAAFLTGAKLKLKFK